MGAPRWFWDVRDAKGKRQKPLGPPPFFTGAVYSLGCHALIRGQHRRKGLCGEVFPLRKLRRRKDCPDPIATLAPQFPTVRIATIGRAQRLKLFGIPALQVADASVLCVIEDDRTARRKTCAGSYVVGLRADIDVKHQRGPQMRRAFHPRKRQNAHRTGNVLCSLIVLRKPCHNAGQYC